ncbi:DUF3858 domain-containing protein [Chitinophaga horti]|uniref:DUF3858 domain-containing protein n=1 Tax=Chitinophaga horti TaxID=2920382 RepID=A0ABY6J4V6_9BACT|nr:DUF3858 domain-containing protein [Chitinophaga horti]UYQ94714.1 DUF3858 domain-containing protein [Chitinophaga horti]
MPLKFTSIVMLCCGLFTLQATAQDKLDVTFGKVVPEDFNKTFTADPDAPAVVLFDIGSTTFETDGGWFQLIFKRHRRVKIVNKNGYDAASEAIPVYVDGMDEERLSNLKGATYNLENGKVVATELESKSVFKDKYDKKRALKKFTMPNVKEGSIVEYSYTITSDFLFNLQPWEFQSTDYPILWSEYKVGIPSWIDYIMLRKGYVKEHIPDKPETKSRTYSFRFEGGGHAATQTYSDVVSVVHHRWVYKDVPALKQEDFTTTIDNHLASVRFQQSAVRIPDQPVKPVLTTWEKLYEKYMEDENLGALLKANNYFLDDQVASLTRGADSKKEKARRIYEFVRDNYTCTNHSRVGMDNSLKTTFSKKNGNVTEINMLLIAMLNKAEIDAYPMILSTRNNGVAYSFYPIFDMFNYTVCAVNDGEKFYYLDASHPYLGFGRLDASCYNGHARILNPLTVGKELSPDSLRERKFTTVMVSPDENGELRGIWKQTPTYFESCAMRERIKESGESSYFSNLSKSYAGEAKLAKTKIDHLAEKESSLGIEYEFLAQEDSKADVLYFSPMFTEAYKHNPFKSTERTYPVEMPCAIDESFTFALIVPEGYAAEELPKSVKVTYGDNEGLFEYLLADAGGTLQMRCRLKLNRATFEPDEYNDLRSFFDMIVKKQAEQIVLKKKK